MIHLSSSELATVRVILQWHVPDRSVLMFGSRLTERVKPFSDLDLAILGDEPISAYIFGNLKEAFSASDLPFRVDVVDWALTAPEFRAQIVATSMPLMRIGEKDLVS